MAYPRHGMSKHPLHYTWSHMKSRCSCPTHQAYKNYGGRGIGVCDEWQDSFETFMEWALSNGWERGLTLDRIDNDGDYEPDNCRWVDHKTQNRNRRTNRYLTFNGESKTLQEWSEITGIPRCTIEKRLDKYGFSVEDALAKDWRKKTYEYNGERHTLMEWSRITGIKYSTLDKRIHQFGYTIEQALTVPLRKHIK